MSKKIIEVGSDEDGETYFVVGDVTRLGAYRAIKKLMRDYGLDEDCAYDMNKEDLEVRNFHKTDGLEFGDKDGWFWWGDPPKGATPIGKGWIYKIF